MWGSLFHYLKQWKIVSDACSAQNTTVKTECHLSVALSYCKHWNILKLAYMLALLKQHNLRNHTCWYLKSKWKSHLFVYSLEKYTQCVLYLSVLKLCWQALMLYHVAQASLIYVSRGIAPVRLFRGDRALHLCVCRLDTLRKWVLFWMYLHGILYKAD